MKRVTLPVSEDRQPTPEQETTRSGQSALADASYPSQQDENSSQLPRGGRSVFPLEFSQVLVPSLKVGGITGTLGLFTGGVASIVRASPHPIIWSMSTSIHWFALGTSYWGTRLVVQKSWEREGEELSPADKIKASAIAGGAAGVAGGLIVGPRSILPALFLWSILGAAGQKVVNELQVSSNVSSSKEKQSWADSSWSPVRKMTDEEYHGYLQEKILNIEAEISVIDDNIRELRASKETKN